MNAAMLAVEADRLATQLDKLAAGPPATHPNRRLLDHLAVERAHLIHVHVLGAARRAGHQLARRTGHPPRHGDRKSWGGNRTWAGAEAWQVLASVPRTATQQARDPVQLLVGLLQAPTPIVADLTIPGR